MQLEDQLFPPVRRPIVRVVTARGDLGAREMGKICAAIGELADKRQSRIVVDWTEVESIDLWAIGVLLSRTHALRHLSGEIKFVRMSSPVRKIFLSYRIDDLYENYATLEEAIKSFEPDWEMIDATAH